MTTFNTTMKKPFPAALPRIKFTAKRSLAAFSAALAIFGAVPFASAASSPVTSGEPAAVHHDPACKSCFWHCYNW